VLDGWQVSEILLKGIITPIYIYMYVSMYGWMDARMDAIMQECMHVSYGWMDGGMHFPREPCQKATQKPIRTKIHLESMGFGPIHPVIRRFSQFHPLTLKKARIRAGPELWIDRSWSLLLSDGLG
jgi:hypothetical protein